MEKRIQLEQRGRKPEDIVDLNLDNCRSTSIEGLTDQFVNLHTLSLIGVGLTSLKGFPKLPNLLRLELSDNRISNGLNFLHTSPKLTTLNMSGNRIADLETLDPLKEFQHLRNLDLFNNSVTRVENYREKAFKLIPSLKSLDGFDAKDQEIEELEDSEMDGDSINGNDEDDSDDLEGDENEEECYDDGEEEEDVEDEEIGLEHVYKSNLEEESEGDDYEGGPSDEEEAEDLFEEEEDDLEESSSANKSGTGAGTEGGAVEERGTKRKHDSEEEVD